jgi:hypothetical protein
MKKTFDEFVSQTVDSFANNVKNPKVKLKIERTPVTFWIPAKSKDKYEVLQTAHKFALGKEISKMIVEVIDRAEDVLYDKSA